MTERVSSSRLVRVGITLAIGGLLALVAGGFAGATSAYGDQFTGCLKGGVISKVKIGAFPTSPCTKPAVKITWNQVGPQGPQGPQGLQGPPGLSNVHTEVSGDVPIADGFKFATVTHCLGLNEIAIGGGVVPVSPSSFQVPFGVTVMSYQDETDTKTWVGSVSNDSGADFTYRVQAICATVA